MEVLILHDSVFEHPTKETASHTKLPSILQKNEVSNFGFFEVMMMMSFICSC